LPFCSNESATATPLPAAAADLYTLLDMTAKRQPPGSGKKLADQPTAVLARE